jgi:cell division initiation protein
MRITPLDIRKQEFRRVMRGVDSEEVYAFLATVAEEYEAALSDNKALRERVLELDDKVQEYRTMERTLRDTLLTAERATTDAKQNAQREADLIIKEAQIEAEKTLRDIKNQMLKLRQEVQTLQRERDSYMARMKILADSFVKFIDSEERQFSADEADDARRMAEPESGEGSVPSPFATEDFPVKGENLIDPPTDHTSHSGPSSLKAPALPQASAGSGTGGRIHRSANAGRFEARAFDGQFLAAGGRSRECRNSHFREAGRTRSECNSGPYGEGTKRDPERDVRYS